MSDTTAVAAPFDLEALTHYLRQHIDCGPADAIAEITPIAGGFSNPTFFLKFSDSADYVLRKKPAGDLLPSAHAIDREYRVMAALENTPVPVPKMLLYCEDESLIGTPFYIMERIQGRVFHDNTLPEMSPEERGQYYNAMNDALAKLHGVDFKAVGLEGFGREGGFIERQIRRWSSQYEKSQSQAIPELDELIQWLRDNLPTEDETTIVHGDFRLGNLMFHPTKPEVVAVLDWELSTLGHPMSDLGYNLMVWKMRDDEFHGIADQDFSSCGIPAVETYIDTYFKNLGRDNDFNPFYLAFSFFRLAVIFDGILNRGGGDPDAHPGVDITQLNKVFASIGLKVAKGQL